MNSEPPFDVIPSIDLLDGKVVRLHQGRYEDVTTYLVDPVQTAVAYWKAGATWVHVVDLDAARAGASPEANATIVRDLVAARPSGCRLQVGGGLRTVEAVEGLLDRGVDAAVIGTLAMRDEAATATLISRHGAAICAAVDADRGRVRVAGWLEDGGAEIDEAIRRLGGSGVSRFLVTAIHRDGTGSGHDLDQLARVRAATDGYVIASGGIGGIEDVRGCRDTGADAAIVGTALLDGRVDLHVWSTLANDG